MENKDENIKQIDVVAIVKAMWQHKKLYFITLPIVCVISCLLIIFILYTIPIIQNRVTKVIYFFL
jgi:hypothetical protein